MRKVALVVVAIVLSVILLGCVGIETSSTPKVSDNQLMQLEVHTAPILNETQTASIGERAYVNVAKEILENVTNQDFAEFIKAKVSDRDYNWFTIALDDGTGIVFNGCMTELFEYGTLDEEGMLEEALGYYTMTADGDIEYNGLTDANESEDDAESNADESKENTSTQTTETVTQKPTETSKPAPTSKPKETTTKPSATTGQANALSEAKSYLRFSSFSREGLIGQLEFEGYTHEEAVYGVDNCGADWFEQALEKAKSYLEYSSFSYQGLIDQLEFEEFTSEQATYGVNNCGADWYEQAAQKAADYLDFSSFSREGLIDQLEFEGFTYDQAVYGVEANGY